MDQPLGGCAIDGWFGRFEGGLRSFFVVGFNRAQDLFHFRAHARTLAGVLQMPLVGLTGAF